MIRRWWIQHRARFARKILPELRAEAKRTSDLAQAARKEFFLGQDRRQGFTADPDNIDENVKLRLLEDARDDAEKAHQRALERLIDARRAVKAAEDLDR